MRKIWEATKDDRERQHSLTPAEQAALVAEFEPLEAVLWFQFDQTTDQRECMTMRMSSPPIPEIYLPVPAAICPCAGCAARIEDSVPHVAVFRLETRGPYEKKSRVHYDLVSEPSPGWVYAWQDGKLITLRVHG